MGVDPKFVELTADVVKNNSYEMLPSKVRPGLRREPDQSKLSTLSAARLKRGLRHKFRDSKCQTEALSDPGWLVRPEEKLPPPTDNTHVGWPDRDYFELCDPHDSVWLWNHWMDGNGRCLSQKNSAHSLGA